MTDSGYTEISSERNKSAAYYSDISITVYDQANQPLVQPQRNNVNSSGDVVMVKVSQQSKPQFIHPQIQQCSSHRNHSQSSLSHVPLGMSSVKSVSVNDFTGSILAADRTNYYKKQNAAAASAAADKMNKNIIDSNEPLYTHVVRKENR